MMYVFMGLIVTDIAMLHGNYQPSTPETQIAKWLMQGIGLIATVAVTVYITRVGQQALKQNVVTADIAKETIKSP